MIAEIDGAAYAVERRGDYALFATPTTGDGELARLPIAVSRTAYSRPRPVPPVREIAYPRSWTSYVVYSGRQYTIEAYRWDPARETFVHMGSVTRDLVASSLPYVVRLNAQHIREARAFFGSSPRLWMSSNAESGVVMIANDTNTKIVWLARATYSTRGAK